MGGKLNSNSKKKIRNGAKDINTNKRKVMKNKKHRERNLLCSFCLDNLRRKKKKKEK